MYVYIYNIYICVCVRVYSVTSVMPTLCDPVDRSPPGSSGMSFHALLQGIFPTQGRTHVS